MSFRSLRCVSCVLNGTPPLGLRVLQLCGLSVLVGVLNGTPPLGLRVLQLRGLSVLVGLTRIATLRPLYDERSLTFSDLAARVEERG